MGRARNVERRPPKSRSLTRSRASITSHCRAHTCFSGHPRDVSHHRRRTVPAFRNRGGGSRAERRPPNTALRAARHEGAPDVSDIFEENLFAGLVCSSAAGADDVRVASVPCFAAGFDWGTCVEIECRDAAGPHSPAAGSSTSPYALVYSRTHTRARTHVHTSRESGRVCARSAVAIAVYWTARDSFPKSFQVSVIRFGLCCCYWVGRKVTLGFEIW